MRSCRVSQTHEKKGISSHYELLLSLIIRGGHSSSVCNLPKLISKLDLLKRSFTNQKSTTPAQLPKTEDISKETVNQTTRQHVRCHDGPPPPLSSLKSYQTPDQLRIPQDQQIPSRISPTYPNINQLSSYANSEQSTECDSAPLSEGDQIYPPFEEIPPDLHNQIHRLIHRHDGLCSTPQDTGTQHTVHHCANPCPVAADAGSSHGDLPHWGDVQHGTRNSPPVGKEILEAPHEGFPAPHSFPFPLFWKSWKRRLDTSGFNMPETLPLSPLRKHPIGDRCRTAWSVNGSCGTNTVGNPGFQSRESTDPSGSQSDLKELNKMPTQRIGNDLSVIGHWQPHTIETHKTGIRRRISPSVVVEQAYPPKRSFDISCLLGMDADEKNSTLSPKV
ncbi:unnamed protein product [Dicrocoelium dendriticum]|nr:unnamed protein product [Dicrocoelium dendriticum]